MKMSNSSYLSQPNYDYQLELKLYQEPFDKKNVCLYSFLEKKVLSELVQSLLFHKYYLHSLHSANDNPFEELIAEEHNRLACRLHRPDHTIERKQAIKKEKSNQLHENRLPWDVIQAEHPQMSSENH